MTNADLFSIIICVVVLVLVALMLQRTKIGKAMRAVADNRDLAASSGIDVNRVILVVWMLGGALADARRRAARPVRPACSGTWASGCCC